jgi:uncharacterized protein YyaL (SSP411 family)
MSESRHTNALIHETSPYLLQHARNPVDWYPWGPEALRRAREEDKPILLSIGYSACHWCHVMERESFEDEETARVMNACFVNIKVDREERPDLDAIYMTAVQLMTGRGGWPMTVFLTPDQKPFFCGTYFPKEDRHGLPGFRRVLAGVASAYEEKRHKILRDADAVTEALAASLQGSGGEGGGAPALDAALLGRAAGAIAAGHDPVDGGFGGAPKFPPSMNLRFLMRAAVRERDRRYMDIVAHTLRRMASGGIYDQLGGGFHRYSVDARWLVPHFEKMLYDNALIARACLEAHLLTGDPFFRRICEETLDYVVREMTAPEGGFYSSQDADSEGEEGAYFTWTEGEIRSLLGEEHARLFGLYYGVTPGGNFEGKNILHVPRSAAEAARAAGVPEARLEEAVGAGRLLLVAAREERVKPGRDEKVLTAWNGLMLGTFAEASSALGRGDYGRVAVQNARFLLSALCGPGGVRRSYKDGRARFDGCLEDYACLVDGLVSLYEADFDPSWIREAERLAGEMADRFWDGDGGGFFFTAKDHEALIHRPKEFWDNATPSGNSVAALALLRLGALTGEERWRGYAEAILELNAGAMARHPAAFGHLLGALDFHLGPVREIAVAGDPGTGAAREMLREIFGRYLPNKAVACGTGGGSALLELRTAAAGEATAWVCEGSTCLEPAASVGELRDRLGPPSRF